MSQKKQPWYEHAMDNQKEGVEVSCWIWQKQSVETLRKQQNVEESEVIYFIKLQSTYLYSSLKQKNIKNSNKPATYRYFLKNRNKPTNTS